MHCFRGMRSHVLGLLLLCSATALAQPRDAPPPAPLPTGPSGDVGPVNPYVNPSQPPAPQTNTPPPSQPPPPSTNVPASPESPTSPPATPPPAAPAPAPSQQQAPAQAPEPNTTPPDARPQPPASEQKPLPPIDKPAPAPIDQPAPASPEKPAQRSTPPTALGTTLAPPGETPPTLAPPGATPAAPLPPMIDVASAPPACRDAGQRASARDRGVALSSKISFAICTANSAVAGLQLVDAEASVREVDQATGNAFGLLDEVAASGDPRWQIVALHAEGDLLAQMTRRMLGTVPPPGANAPPSAVALHDSRAQLLQPHLAPWISRAQRAFAQVDELARSNPQVTRSKIVADAVIDSRRRLTNGVATR